MKAPSKISLVMGALALTATALLAGGGGSSTASTAASEPAESEAPMSEPSAASEAPMSETPAASEAPMLEVPVSISDGLLKPAGVAQDDWETVFQEVANPLATQIANATPEELAEAWETGKKEIAAQAADVVESYLPLGGTPEEWTVIWGTVFENIRLMACSAAE